VALARRSAVSTACAFCQRAFASVVGRGSAPLAPAVTDFSVHVLDPTVAATVPCRTTTMSQLVIQVCATADPSGRVPVDVSHGRGKKSGSCFLASVKPPVVNSDPGRSAGSPDLDLDEPTVDGLGIARSSRVRTPRAILVDRRTNAFGALLVTSVHVVTLDPSAGASQSDTVRLSKAYSRYVHFAY